MMPPAWLFNAALASVDFPPLRVSGQAGHVSDGHGNVSPSRERAHFTAGPHWVPAPPG